MLSTRRLWIRAQLAHLPTSEPQSPWGPHSRCSPAGQPLFSPTYNAYFHIVPPLRLCQRLQQKSMAREASCVRFSMPIMNLQPQAPSEGSKTSIRCLDKQQLPRPCNQRAEILTPEVKLTTKNPLGATLGSHSTRPNVKSSLYSLSALLS